MTTQMIDQDTVLNNKSELNDATAQKQQMMKEQSKKIIAIADAEAESSLKCIHMLSVAGGATEETYVAIEERIVKDKDAYGAYHLALMAQSTPDLPVDARQLIDLVVAHGDSGQLMALLKNLPLPPVDAIKERIMTLGNEDIIAQMTAYLQTNPEGYGSDVVLGSGQKDRIVPLSQGLS